MGNRDWFVSRSIEVHQRQFSRLNVVFLFSLCRSLWAILSTVGSYVVLFIEHKTENNLNASNDRILIQIRNTANQFESSGITKINSSETWIIETISFRTAHWVRWTVQCDRFVYAKRAASRMFDSIFHYFTTVQFESKELKKLLLSIIEYEYSRNMNDHSIWIGTNFSK